MFSVYELGHNQITHNELIQNNSREYECILSFTSFHY